MESKRESYPRNLTAMEGLMKCSYCHDLVWAIMSRDSRCVRCGLPACAYNERMSYDFTAVKAHYQCVDCENIWKTTTNVKRPCQQSGCTGKLYLSSPSTPVLGVAAECCDVVCWSTNAKLGDDIQCRQCGDPVPATRVIGFEQCTALNKMFRTLGPAAFRVSLSDVGPVVFSPTVQPRPVERRGKTAATPAAAAACPRNMFDLL